MMAITLMCLLSLPVVIRGQTATTGTVVGAVTDPTGAVVSGAKVVLKDLATQAERTTQTNEAGQYTFTTLPPGQYSVTVSVPGFRQAVVTAVKVEVAKSALVDVRLEVGQAADRVEISAVGQELQTSDSTVGEVVDARSLVALPTVQRRAVELVFLQAASTPNTRQGITGRSIAGGRGDQNTYILDGLDVSDAQVGGTCCGNIGMGLPLNVESLTEFRASVTNQNASFGRSGGGQYAMTTRRGSNDLHGAAYWYHRNDDLNANSWVRNRLGQKDPELKDNRAGFRLGGPFIKDKLFYFLNWELRRRPQPIDLARIVPSDTLRQGILRFPDNAGNIVSYNLASSTLCGPAGNQPCDPRGVGLSPLIAKHFALLPKGNDSTAGDGLNLIGVRGPADATVENDFALGRLDYRLTDKWQFSGLWVWAQNRNPGSGDIFLDIRGGPNEFKTLSQVPNDPRHYNFSVTGQLTPTLVNEARFGYNKSTIVFRHTQPTPLVEGSGVALDLARLDEPIDISAARGQVGISTTWQFVDNLTWVKGKHTFQGGVNAQWLRAFHSREQAAGVHLRPMAQIGATTNTVILPASRPPTCSATRTTNCLRAADVAVWNNLYGALLGMVDSVRNFVVRDMTTGKQDLDPQVLSQGVINAGDWQHLEFYGTDTWRVSNSLTLSLGLNSLIELPFVEDKGRQAFLIDLVDRQPVSVNDYLARRAEAARQGQIYNPGFAYAPLSAYPERRIMPVHKSLAPRLAAAWQPSFQQGFWRRLLGERKTVMRGGFGIAYNRANWTGFLTQAMTGNAALAQPNSILVPKCNVNGTPGLRCVATDPNPAISSLRVGVDGPAPAPSVAAQISIPFVVPQTFGQGVATGWAPDFKLGRVHSADLTIQRELPGDFLLEVGWIGRFGRNLMVQKNANAVPFFIRDLSGRTGQTFAQAFDAVAAELRAGVAPANITPQPWFENSITTGATRALATNRGTDFINGLVANLWLSGAPGAATQGIDPWLIFLGRQPVNSRQIQRTAIQTHGGWNNYHALIVSLNKRLSHGASFNFNYTLSKNLETLGSRTDTGIFGFSMNPFDLNYAYGPSIPDRRHGINFYGVWELPFGSGRRFNTGGWGDQVIGGWQVSAVAQWFSGLPLFVTAGGQPFGSLVGQESAPAIRDPQADPGRHSGVAGSGGVGTAGDPATGGTGLNLFANPKAVFDSFRMFRISEDGRDSRGVIRGLPWTTFDLSLAKRISVKERLNIRFSFDFLNVLNHPLFEDPTLDLLNPRTFGVISAEPLNPLDHFWAPRQAQFGLRIEF
jgi:hypothetical protein